MSIIERIRRTAEEVDPKAVEGREWAERKAAEHGWTLYDGAEIEPYGRRGLLAHEPTDAILQTVSINPEWTHERDLQRITGWYVNPSGFPVFVEPASKGPRTLTQARALAAERRRQDEAREQEEARRLASQPRRAVTAADLEDWPKTMTLREAVQALEAVQGVIREHAGELIVELPEKLPQRPRALAACRVVFAARGVVLAELARNSAVPLAERLPDAEVRAGGGVVGDAHQGSAAT